MSTKSASDVITYAFTLTEIVSLFIGIVSIVLGVFAIWLTLHLKTESEALNKETKDLLMEIKTDAKSITRGVLSEMEKWGEAGRTALTSTTEERRSGGVGINTIHTNNNVQSANTAREESNV